jgi:RNA polymerase primary sigma factor
VRPARCGAGCVPVTTRTGLAELDARAHFVIVRRFGLDGEPEQCLASIGRQLKLSKETVRQIERKALDRLLILTHGGRGTRRTSS